MICLRLTLIIISLFSFGPAFGQQSLSITTNNPDSLFVCGTDTISVQVINTGASALNTISVEVELPSGVSYVPNSVTGASETNITNLGVPRFGVASLAVGATAMIQIEVKAGCNLVESINGGQLFFHKIKASVGVINEQLSSSQYQINTGLLIFSSVTPNVVSGSAPQVVQRTIKVKNTRLGKIGNIRFVDDFKFNDFAVNIAGLTDINPLDTIYEALISSALINGVGNNDEWLDQNEELVFVEDITISDCRDTAYEVKSNLRIFWGCDTEVCSYDSIMAFVRVLPAGEPKLVFTAELLPFFNQCAGAAAVQLINIKNEGSSEAVATTIEVIGEPGFMAFDHTSFEVNLTGTWAPISATLFDLDSNMDCTTKPLSRKVFLSLGNIAPQAVVEVRVPMYGCAPDSCQIIKDSIPIDFTYRRPCSTTMLASGREHFDLDSLKFKFDFQAVHSTNACLTDGQSTALEFQVRSNLLTTHQGFVKIQLELPRGLELDTMACKPRLKNNNALAQGVIITPSANGGSIVNFNFPTPMTFDSIRIEYCVKYTCQPNMDCKNDTNFPNMGGLIPAFVDSFGNPVTCDFPCALEVNAKGALTIDALTEVGCAFGTCDSYFLVVDDICNNPPIDTSTCWPAGMIGTYDVYRTNYDCEDKDNDQVADSNLDATGPNIAIRRFIPGDTLRLDMRGVVVTPSQIEFMPFKVFHETLTSDFLVAGGDSFRVDISGPTFCSKDNFVFVGGTLQVKRTDGSISTCPLNPTAITDQHLVEVQIANQEPKQVIEYLATMDHAMLADFVACSGSPITLGDSAILMMDWQIKKNILPFINDTSFSLRLMNFRTVPDGVQKQYTYLKPNPEPLCQYSGFLGGLVAPVVTIRPCENSQQVTGFRYEIILARANMFPYEVRPLKQFLEYIHTAPNGADLLSVRLNQVRLQTAKQVLATTNLTFANATSGQTEIDFTPLSSLKLDEGFQLDIDFEYGANCGFTEAEPYNGEVTSWNKPCFTPTIIDTSAFGASPGYYSAVPKVQLFATDSLFIIPGKTLSTPLTMRNLSPQTARNPWIKIETVSGTYTNLQLLQNGNPVTKIGDIYQLPNLGNSATAITQLNVTITSCTPLVLHILFGWDCDQVTSTNGELCFRDTFLIELKTLAPELELDLVHQPIEVDMCDTTDWFTVEIYNANLGYAYDLMYIAKLPDGLTFEPGTAQISFPTGSPFQALANPQPLANNQYQWNLSTLISSLSTGLLGVNMEPQNSMTIRFRARTQCGFVANTQPLFTASARKPCNAIANILRKPGAEVELQGIAQPYQTQINISPSTPGALNCGDETSLDIQVVLGGVPSPGDSIFLVIPNGFSYIAGSYSAGLNAPAGPPVTTNGWQIAIPTNLTSGSVIKFSVKLKYEQPAGCTDVTLAVQTRQSASIFCPAINMNCGVYIASGESLYNIPVINNDLSIAQLSLDFANSAYVLSGQLINQSNFATGFVPIDIYVDANGNGEPDLGETKVITVTNTTNIPAFGAESFAATLTGLSPADLCKLLVYISPIDACICAPISVPLQNISINTEPFTACDIVPVNLGIANLAGHTYAWSPPLGLSCTACPNTTFTPGTGVQSGDAFTFILTDQSPGCQVQYRFDVNFIGTPTITASDATICRGQSVTLSVNPSTATNISWTGIGINQPGAITQTVSPNATSVYTVTASVATGCTGTDQVTITVLEKDSVVLAPVQICQGDAYFWMGDSIKTSGYYCQSFASNSGCDSLICLEVNVLPTQSNASVILCEGSTVLVFDSVVTQAGQHCRVFQNALGCDSTHCITLQLSQGPSIAIPDTVFVEIGDTAQIIGPAGYTQYLWSPNTGLSCTDCQSPLVVGLDTIEYILVVTDANGCTGEVAYRVLPLPPCDPNNIEIPNAFTPDNGDDVNDVFRVPDLEGVEIIESMVVFNRWGQLIYEASGPNVFWDGKVNGAYAPMDTYVYRIMIGCPSSNEGSERIGEITLIR
jgi:gliding motility-associated-like protein